MQPESVDGSDGSSRNLPNVAAFNTSGPFLTVDIGYFFVGLSQGQPGAAEDAFPAVDQDFPPTRYSIEISRLAPQISVRQQNLALDVILEMADRPEAVAA